jgi:alpha/beta superfamily hydrolase
MQLDLTGPAGRLEALIDLPARMPRAAAVLAHPHPEYGGTMRARVVHEVARTLTHVGVAVVRFNYRGVGVSAGAFSGGPAEAEDLRSALDVLDLRFPDTPLWAIGYSFGAWLAMTAGAADPRVEVLVGIAPPVEHYDFSSLLASTKPKFFIAGERDEVAPLKAVQRFYARMPEPRELVVIDGADHAFDGKAGEVGDAVVDLVGDFGDTL